MAKKITVTPEVRAQLQEEFDISNTATIYNALNYETDSPSARMIRRRALELGGQEWQTTDELAQTQPACTHARSMERSAQ